jgi:hypothetical protein
LAIRRGQRAWFVGYVLAAAAGMYFHYYAALVTLLLHLWLWLAGRMESGAGYRKRWINVLPADGFLLLLCLPLVAYFLRGAGQVSGGFWLTRPTVVAPLSTLHLFTVSYSLSGAAAIAAFVLTLALVALVLLEIVYAFRREPEQRPALLLLLMLAFLPVLLVFLVSQIIPVYLDRTLIIITPAYAMLLGRALATTRLRSPTPYVAGAIVAMMLLSLYGYYFDPRHDKPDYRAAAAHVAQQLEPGEPLVHTGNGGYLPFLFYLGPEGHYLLDGDPAPHHPAGLHETAGGRTIEQQEWADWPSAWFVVVFDHSVPYQQQLVGDLDGRYPLLQEAVIDGIVLRRYDLSDH